MSAVGWEGLLSLAEAQECERLGYRGNWVVIYHAAIDDIPIYQNLDRASYEFLEAKFFLIPYGFAPAEGFWLPMEAAPTERHPLDHGKILVVVGDPRRDEVHGFEVVSTRTAGRGHGWCPIVRRILGGSRTEDAASPEAPCCHPRRGVVTTHPHGMPAGAHAAFRDCCGSTVCIEACVAWCREVTGLPAVYVEDRR